MKNEISEETVIKIAELSKLSLTSQEVKKFQSDIEKLVQTFAVIKDASQKKKSQINTTDSIANHETRHDSRTRSDTPNNSISTKTFLKEVPEKEGCFIRVPAMLEDS